MIPENDLIHGCLSGDPRMQEVLYQRYAPKMYAVCLRYAGNPEDAQDILQEGFVKVFRSLGKFRGDGSFEGWVRRIFVNTAIEHHRKSLQWLPLTDREVETEVKTLTALDKMAMDDIMQMIQSLPAGYRTVFNLYVVEGYGHKEIADMLGISEGTSKSQLARAKTALQEMIRKKTNQF